MAETHRWIGAISALFGAWVFVSAFVFGWVGAHFWNGLVVGAAIVVLAGYSATQASESHAGNPWASGLAALLGLWMIASPFVYGAMSTAMWSSIISGVVVAILSGYHAYEARETTTVAPGEEAGA